MNKIMFDDNVKLTQLVIEELKTSTRRIIPQSELDKINRFQEEYYDLTFDKLEGIELIKHYYLVEKRGRLPYQIGEIVAVAQSYKTLFEEQRDDASRLFDLRNSAGWNNKMFVKAALMHRRIQMLDVKFEMLQDISDDDCLKEGVVVNEPKIKGGINMYYPCEYLRSCAKEVGWGRVFHTPREAFAELINKVSRKDVWSLNPYVYAYDFELVK